MYHSLLWPVLNGIYITRYKDAQLCVNHRSINKFERFDIVNKQLLEQTENAKYLGIMITDSG